MEIALQSIGIIHTPFHEKPGTPIQSARSDAPGWVEVFPEFSAGLDGVEDFSRLYLIYVFDRSDPVTSLHVKPFLDDQLHGIFATRYPVRPNGLGLSIVAVASRESNILRFTGADMLDGTPLLDIKPYLPEFDHFNVEKIGWYQNRKYA
jgi:tRNA-Thr(GGU) m(6)t(6)A37 methyltransferase TsaA